MNVLVVNAGSSSLKYQFFDTTNGTVVAKGLCDRIGIDGTISHKNLTTGAEYSAEVALPNHSVATKLVVECLLSAEHGCVSSMDEIEAVGHRIVHGGAYFSESMLLSDDVLAKLELCIDLAPLHTPAHIMGIRGCLDVMPDVPQVLVFDTAFHQTMPDYAYMYPIPYEMYEDWSIRRYGAHGTSHRYVAGECIKLLGGNAEGTKIITCHLGNGSSISAVKDGKVMDTSMGFTPLAGIEMGTRTGDIDPAIVPFIMNKTGMTPDEMNSFMNKKCGLLGVSGVSSDCRDVTAAIAEGNKRAKLAFDILAYVSISALIPLLWRVLMLSYSPQESARTTLTSVSSSAPSSHTSALTLTSSSTATYPDPSSLPVLPRKAPRSRYSSFLQTRSS